MARKRIAKKAVAVGVVRDAMTAAGELRRMRAPVDIATTPAERTISATEISNRILS
jgi:hypothetical protein